MPYNYDGPVQSFNSIDRHYQRYLSEYPEFHERWLLEQTLYSGGSRRAILGILPIFNGDRILDIGTGFGALAIDMAAYKSVSIDAVDVDETVLDIAAGIYRKIAVNGVFRDKSQISFSKADVYGLAFEENSFDFVVARFVYQHLRDPWNATRELRRVLKPGGHLCLIDVDDQLSLTYPNEKHTFEKLQEVMGLVQERRGGDRHVGRKLASFMHEEGLEVTGTVIQPETQFVAAAPNDPGIELTAQRFRAVKNDVVEQGLMTEEEFENSVQEFLDDMSQWKYHAHGTMLVLGRK